MRTQYIVSTTLVRQDRHSRMLTTVLKREGETPLSHVPERTNHTKVPPHYYSYLSYDEHD